MKNVKVILWGLGAMGGGIGKMLTKKKGVDIVGAIDIGAKVGKSLYEVVPGIVKGDRALGGSDTWATSNAVAAL